MVAARAGAVSAPIAIKRSWISTKLPGYAAVSTGPAGPAAPDRPRQHRFGQALRAVRRLLPHRCQPRPRSPARTPRRPAPGRQQSPATKWTCPPHCCRPGQCGRPDQPSGWRRPATAAHPGGWTPQKPQEDFMAHRLRAYSPPGNRLHKSRPAAEPRPCFAAPGYPGLPPGAR